MILHVVLYQLRASATPKEREALAAALYTACREIPTIQHVRIGKTINLQMGYMDRSKSQQYDYVAVLEFMDEEGLRAYMVHPRHRELSELFWKVCEKTTIVDAVVVDPTVGDLIGQTG